MTLFGSNAVFDAWMEGNLLTENPSENTYVVLAKFSLENGFVLKANGSLLLHTASRLNKSIIVDFLIKAGADVNFRDAEGQTAINYATVQFVGGARSRVENACKLVDYLVQKGASLSLQDNSGGSVLHQWAFDPRYNQYNDSHNKDILGRLLHHNVPLDLVNKEGNTAFMYAAAHSTGRFLLLLTAMKKHFPANREFMIDQQNFQGDTCAHLVVVRTGDQDRTSSARNDNFNDDALKMLMSMGASLHIPNNNGKTAIDCVLECRSGSDRVRQVLHTRTHECMLAFLMGAHVRLGSTSYVKHLDDIVLDIIVGEMQGLLKTIQLNSFNNLFM